MRISEYVPHQILFVFLGFYKSCNKNISIAPLDIFKRPSFFTSILFCGGMIFGSLVVLFKTYIKPSCIQDLQTQRKSAILNKVLLSWPHFASFYLY